MPAPPRKGETQKKFLGRCIPTYIREGRSPDQAKGICYSMWRKKHGGKKPSDSEESINDTELLKGFSLEWESLRDDGETKSDQDKMRELERK